jgi:hypothetical protein
MKGNEGKITILITENEILLIEGEDYNFPRFKVKHTYKDIETLKRVIIVDLEDYLNKLTKQ